MQRVRAAARRRRASPTGYAWAVELAAGWASSCPRPAARVPELSALPPRGPELRRSASAARRGPPGRGRAPVAAQMGDGRARGTTSVGYRS